MKRILTSILVAAGIGGPFVSHLAAQHYQLVADVPFAFVANGTNLPAGKYAVSRQTASSAVWALRGTLGNGIVAQFGIPQDGSPNNPSLTFACYGKECVLAKINPGDGQSAYGVSSESIEKNLHHKLGMASMLSVKLTAR